MGGRVARRVEGVEVRGVEDVVCCGERREGAVAGGVEEGAQGGGCGVGG